MKVLPAVLAAYFVSLASAQPQVDRIEPSRRIKNGIVTKDVTSNQQSRAPNMKHRPRDSQLRFLWSQQGLSRSHHGLSSQHGSSFQTATKGSLCGPSPGSPRLSSSSTTTANATTTTATATATATTTTNVFGQPA